VPCQLCQLCQLCSPHPSDLDIQPWMLGGGWSKSAGQKSGPLGCCCHSPTPTHLHTPTHTLSPQHTHTLRGLRALMNCNYYGSHHCVLPASTLSLCSLGKVPVTIRSYKWEKVVTDSSVLITASGRQSLLPPQSFSLSWLCEEWKGLFTVIVL
jgi:hypothetical protein